jgi:hypothetical protein
MDKNDLLLEQLKLAAEMHRSQDDLMWQRFNAFVTLTGILLSGLGIILAADRVSSGNKQIATAIFSFLGFIGSFTFASVLRRVYLYHSHRIGQAAEAEKQLATGLGGKSRVYVKGIDEKPDDEHRLIWWLFSRWRTGNVVLFFILLVLIGWGIALTVSIVLLID